MVPLVVRLIGLGALGSVVAQIDVIPPHWLVLSCNAIEPVIAMACDLSKLVRADMGMLTYFAQQH